MRCQKCGYVSFDHLLACKKCGNDATAAREMLGLVAGKPTMPFFLGALIGGGDTAPAAAVAASPAPQREPSHEDMDSLFAEIDFGADDLEFDLTEETSPKSGTAAAATSASQKAGSDLEELDDIELVIGSALDEELAVDMSALDDDPSEPKVQEDDFELAFDLEESKPVASAKAPKAESASGAAKGDEGDITLGMDTGMDFELDLGELVPSQGAETKAEAAGFEEEMVIDLGDEELTGLIQELEDPKKGAKASV